MNQQAMIASLITSCFLASCGGSSDTGPNTGFLSIAVTDAPVDNATAVVVEFTGVELQGPGGRTTFDFDSPSSIDLLTLSGNNSELILPQTELSAGNYQWMRLKINAAEGTTDSYIDLDDGTRHSLYIPSGAQTGLQLNRPFTIAAGGRSDFTIDFDLRKSVHKPASANSDYFLRPTLRVTDNLETGNLSGSVSNEFVSANSCTANNAAVYLFDDFDAELDDMDANLPEPVTTTLVTLSPAGNFYEIGFVEAGNYTLAITCESDLDDPETDDEIVFADIQNVTVDANATAQVDF